MIIGILVSAIDTRGWTHVNDIGRKLESWDMKNGNEQITVEKKNDIFEPLIQTNNKNNFITQ
ncbi:MAG: hypothetical protein ACR2PH_02495, partial [Desulfobulbia bacterium]